MHHRDDDETKKEELASQLKELSTAYASDEKFQQALEKNEITRDVQQLLENDQLLNISRGFER